MNNQVIYTPELAEQLPAMFNNGATIEEVCAELGIDEKTFDYWKAQYPDFDHAAKMGEIRAEAFYDDLLSQACKGELNHKNLDADKIVEILRTRFTEDYSY